MIRSFADKRTAALFSGLMVKGLAHDVQDRAHVKLLMIDAAVRLDDLRVPPGNRLGALHGGRKGQHSIRINDQWRVCFVWDADGASDVEVVDYH
ncbi:MAG: type II toxin-antitoxin system RelE/ParE family toxin [Rhodospirillales bacterium]